MDYEKMKIMEHNLVHIRKSLNMSAKELGDMIGVTRQTINNIEFGRSKMTGPQYLAILYVLENVIFSKLSKDEIDIVRKLLSIEVKNSDYKKSLSFVEEA